MSGATRDNVACSQQGSAHVRPDEACASGDKDPRAAHISPLLIAMYHPGLIYQTTRFT
jgi:hypothetical protein